MQKYILFIIMPCFFVIDTLSQSAKVIYGVEPLNKKDSPVVNKINPELEFMQFNLSYDKDNSFFFLNRETYQKTN